MLDLYYGSCVLTLGALRTAGWEGRSIDRGRLLSLRGSGRGVIRGGLLSPRIWEELGAGRWY